jgi:hypothetical protein
MFVMLAENSRFLAPISRQNAFYIQDEAKYEDLILRPILRRTALDDVSPYGMLITN